MSLSFALAATAAIAPFAWAHFKLLEPASWIEEDANGDPQKLGPCGGTSANAAKGKAANPGTPTNMVTKVQGGQKLHIKLQETVFHPGHYRIALAVNSRAELPPDPEVVTRDSDKGPVVRFRAHRENAETSGAGGRVVRSHLEAGRSVGDRRHAAQHQLREVHAADHPVHGRARPELGWRFSYHHCADLQITADPAKPIDRAWLTTVGVPVQRKK